MRKNKLLSILMVGLMSLSLMSCGTKETNETPNGDNQGNVEVNETQLVFGEKLPEQDLLTDYLKETLLGGEELYQDSNKFYDFYWTETKVDQTFLDKYNLKAFEGDYEVADIQKLNPMLFAMAREEHAIRTLFSQNNIVYLAERDFMPFVQEYIEYAWMGNKIENIKISDEFKALDPQKTFQKYLKDNKIEINGIVYPTKAEDLIPIGGNTVLVTSVTIDYNQNGENKSETFYIDVYLTLANEIRSGELVKVFEPSDFEIMGITIASNSNEEVENNVTYSYEKGLKMFGIAK